MYAFLSCVYKDDVHIVLETWLVGHGITRALIRRAALGYVETEVALEEKVGLPCCLQVYVIKVLVWLLASNIDQNFHVCT